MRGRGEEAQERRCRRWSRPSSGLRLQSRKVASLPHFIPLYLHVNEGNEEKKDDPKPYSPNSTP